MEKSTRDNIMGKVLIFFAGALTAVAFIEFVYNPFTNKKTTPTEAPPIEGVLQTPPKETK